MLECVWFKSERCEKLFEHTLYGVFSPPMEPYRLMLLLCTDNGCQVVLTMSAKFQLSYLIL